MFRDVRSMRLETVEPAKKENLHACHDHIFQDPEREPFR